MRMVYVRLKQPEIDALVRLVREHRRHPHDEGALLVVESLRRAGALPPELPAIDTTTLSELVTA